MGGFSFFDLNGAEGVKNATKKEYFQNINEVNGTPLQVENTEMKKCFSNFETWNSTEESANTTSLSGGLWFLTVCTTS